MSDTPAPLALPIRRQQRNANAHTPRGMEALQHSVAQDGWIGAITVAADGETFDGSARVEVAGDALAEAIVVETDGTRPVVLKRTDIPSAADPRAQRLGIAANRIAELNLAWDAAVLAGAADDGVVLDWLYTAKELEKVFASLPLGVDVEEGEGEGAAGSDTTPPGELPDSYIKMVQLFLTTETHPEFLDAVQALMEPLGQTTITDTVLEAVRYAYRTLVAPAAG